MKRKLTWRIGLTIQIILGLGLMVSVLFPIAHSVISPEYYTSVIQACAIGAGIGVFIGLPIITIMTDVIGPRTDWTPVSNWLYTKLTEHEILTELNDNDTERLRRSLDR